MYPDDATQVHKVVSNLEGGATRRLVSMHDSRAPELGDLDTFMQILRTRFEKVVRCAESCICTFKQGKQLVIEYIQDFHI